MHHDENRREDEERRSRESNVKPAGGSRENTERGQSELPPSAFGEGSHDSESAGGISNRPLDEEQDRQEHLPPRGERRENWKDD